MNRLLAILAAGMMMILPGTANAEETPETNDVNGTAQTDRDHSDYTFRVGGYGEILGNYKDYGLNRWNGTLDGIPKKNRGTVSIPRFVIALDYKFSEKWILGAEIEFESGGTGTTYELEEQSGSENTEYETEIEKGGEVALEQFHITRLIVPEFNLRAGHMIVPVGLTNTHHEPINFFGSSRPEGESTMMPCTWHETGIEAFGSFGSGYASFDYEAMVVAGANPNGFDKYHWIKGGRQGFFEADNFTSPAYVLRLNYTGVPGLRLGGSFYYVANAARNADKLTTYDQLGSIPVRLWSLDAQYTNRYVVARANYVGGNIGNADGIQSINRSYSNLSPYSRQGSIAKKALTYSAEAGVNLKALLGQDKKFPAIWPFVHYEYYNTQEKAEKPITIMDDRCQVSMWTFGLNWRPLPTLVVKADYTTRQIGTGKMFGTGPYNSENEFGVCVAYTGWFFKK